MNQLMNVKYGLVRTPQTGTATHPDANPKWAKPYGTITYQKDAFIVIKNSNKNPVVSSKAPQLPEGQGQPVVV